jgi:hypothetical protein
MGHGTDSFTSPPEEGMLRIFTSVKIQRLRPGSNPRPWVPEASMLTTRPPKLSLFNICCILNILYSNYLNINFERLSWGNIYCHVILEFLTRWTFLNLDGKILINEADLLYRILKTQISQNGISHVKIRKAVTINTEITCTVVTLELRPAQQLQG